MRAHSQKLELQRAERGKAKTETPSDPAVTKFVNYVDDNDLERDSVLVREAAEGRTPTEALDYLRDKLKAQKTSTDEARIAKLVEEKAKVVVEQRLKESGLTSKGAGGPNAATLDDKAFLESFSKGEKNNPEDFKRAAEIVAK